MYSEMRDEEISVICEKQESEVISLSFLIGLTVYGCPDGDAAPLALQGFFDCKSNRPRTGCGQHTDHYTK